MSFAEITTPRALVRHYADVRARLRGPVEKPRIPVQSAPPPPVDLEVSPLTKARKPKTDSIVVASVNICAEEPIEFKKLPTPIERSPIKMGDISRAVCEHFGLKQQALCSRSRELHVCRPRQIAMYLGRQLTDRSFPYIASKFGRLDHTTAISSVRRIAKLLPEDERTAYHVATIEAELVARFHVRAPDA